MKVIHVWLAPSDQDTAIHYWYQLIGNILPRRLCDGGMGSIDSKTDQSGEVCLLCRATYLADRRLGRHVFRFRHASLEACLETSTALEVAIPCLGVLPSLGEKAAYVDGERHTMTTVHMSGFGRVYEATGDQKIEEVRRIKRKRGRYQYWPLVRQMKREHWGNENIEKFRNAFPSFLEEQPPDKKEEFLLLGTAYIEFCQKRSALYLPHGQRTLPFAGLRIRVDPEVVMENVYGEKTVLKLWFDEAPPTRDTRQVLCFLIEEASKYDHADYGILDILSQDVVLSGELASKIRGKVEEEARTFLDIWNKLDDEAMNFFEEPKRE